MHPAHLEHHTRNPAHPAVFYGGLALAGAVIIGGALWWRKASAAVMPTGTDATAGGNSGSSDSSSADTSGDNDGSSKSSSDADLLSGPLRWAANGEKVRVGQTVGGGAAKIMRVQSYRGFAYGTAEYFKRQDGVYSVDPLTGTLSAEPLSIEPGDCGWAIQIAPSLDPINSPTVYPTEAAAASGARSFINENYSWLEERMMIG